MQRSSHLHTIPNLTTIFLTEPADSSSGGLLHYLKVNHTLPERIIILSINIEDIPAIMDNKRVQFQELAKGFYRLVLHYGFMQDIDVPKAISEIHKRAQLPLPIGPQNITYFTESKNITVTTRKQPYFRLWQKNCFIFYTITAYLLWNFINCRQIAR